jgi:hypothetical protein
MQLLGYSNPTFRNFGDGELGYSFADAPRPSIFHSPAALPPFVTASAPVFKTPTFSPAPTFTTAPQRQSGTSLHLNEIFQGGLGVFSQFLAGRSKNPTAQILTGSGAFRPIEQATGSGNPTYGTGGISPEQQAAAINLAAAQTGGVGASAVNTAAGFLDGLAQSFGISTTTLTLLGIGGAYLLFRTPPKRK